jgi:hypothetical protein
MRIEVSHGELADKVTILSIKARKVSDPGKRANIKRELSILSRRLKSLGLSASDPLYRELLSANEELWDIEDAIRRKEAAGIFDDEFIRLARAVYQRNDCRAAIKRRIDESTGSPLIEEKEYVVYPREIPHPDS